MILLFQDVNPASANITTTYEIQNTLHGIEMRMSDTDSTPDFRDNRMYTMPETVNISPLSKYLISNGKKSVQKHFSFFS
jgi:hypothetical protein